MGTTQRPFDAELQPFCKVYQKIILVPRPDYASRYGKYFYPLPCAAPEAGQSGVGLPVCEARRGALMTQGHQVTEGESVHWRGVCAWTSAKLGAVNVSHWVTRAPESPFYC